MGKRWGWFAEVKKALSFKSNDNKRSETKSCRLGRCFGKQASKDLDGGVAAAVDSPVVEDVKLMEAENEQNRHAYSVALVTAMAAEAAVAAAHAAAEVVRLRTAACKTKEEIAAAKIQTAFRGYLAKRELRTLRGQARLKSLIGGHSVKRQAAATSKCLQTMARLRSEAHAWRIQISDGNHAIQSQIQHKQEKEVVCKEGTWNGSMQSKDRLESTVHNRRAAAIRRERALAYAYSHQKTWRNSANQMIMDPNDPQWGWNWLERWVAARENGSKAADSDHISGKSLSTGRSICSPIARKRAQWQSPLTPKSKGAVKMQQLISISTDNDSKSMNSGQSGQRPRPTSIASSSVRDDDSLTVSSPATSVPSYMSSTESTRAKLRLPSPLREKTCHGKSSAKKRLSFSSQQ